jgi:hypothetical protein
MAMWNKREVVVLNAFGGVCLMLVCACGSGLGYRGQAREMLRQLEQATTPAELRTWLADTVQANAELQQDGGSMAVPESGLPQWVSSIQARHPFLGARIYVSNSVPYVSFSWGSGRGLCGYDVSLSTNRPPLTSDLFFIVEHVPGIYAWHSRPDR